MPARRDVRVVAASPRCAGARLSLDQGLSEANEELARLLRLCAREPRRGLRPGDGNAWSGTSNRRRADRRRLHVCAVDHHQHDPLVAGVATRPWVWEKPTRRGFPGSLATRPYRARPELAAPRDAAASVRTTRATRASGTARRMRSVRPAATPASMVLRARSLPRTWRPKAGITRIMSATPRLKTTRPMYGWKLSMAACSP